MQNEQSNRFQYLLRELKLEILSRLPAAYMLRCREVCKDWKAVLCASSDSGDPSPPLVLSSDFLNFWIKHRPRESWLFLQNEIIFNKFLLYDVKNQVCYRWCPPSSVSGLWDKMDDGRVLLTYGVQIWNTTSNGLLFLVHGLDENHAKTRICGIWSCNPLTGYVTKLPAISGNSVVAAALVANDDRTTRSEPHYNVLLIESSVDIVPPANDHEYKVHLYSSKEKRWETQESIHIHPISTLAVVTRFCEHDLIYFLVHPSKRSSDADGIPKWELKWLNIQEHIWYSCSLSPLPDTDNLCGSKFILLERNKHLIVVASLMAIPLQVTVYKSVSAITNGIHCNCMLLSAMPADVISRLHPDVAVPPSGLLFQVYPTVSPFPDKIEGDKIIFFFVGVRSYAIVCFNLENPAQDAWRVMAYSRDLMNEQPLTQFDEKIDTWSKSSILQLLYAYPNTRSMDGSIKMVTFEPRLDNAHVE